MCFFQMLLYCLVYTILLNTNQGIFGLEKFSNKACFKHFWDYLSVDVTSWCFEMSSWLIFHRLSAIKFDTLKCQISKIRPCWHLRNYLLYYHPQKFFPISFWHSQSCPRLQSYLKKWQHLSLRAIRVGWQDKSHLRNDSHSSQDAKSLQ